MTIAEGREILWAEHLSNVKSPEQIQSIEEAMMLEIECIRQNDSDWKRDRRHKLGNLDIPIGMYLSHWRGEATRTAAENIAKKLNMKKDKFGFYEPA
jgi:hypothetical protein